MPQEDSIDTVVIQQLQCDCIIGC